jgi:hypothetical protein
MKPAEEFSAERSRAVQQPEQQQKGTGPAGPSQIFEIHWGDRKFTYPSKEEALEDGFHL